MTTFAMDFRYTWSAATTAPPAGNQVRVNGAPPYQTVTEVWVRYSTVDGLDAYLTLMQTPPGATLILQTRTDHTLATKFTVKAAPVDNAAGGYITFPVTWVQTTGTLLGGQDVQLFLLNLEATPAPTPDPDELYDRQLAVAEIAGMIAAGMSVPFDRGRLFRGDEQDAAVAAQVESVATIAVQAAVAVIGRVKKLPSASLLPMLPGRGDG